MRKSCIMLAAFCVVLGACNAKSADNSENSLDWAGEYEGTLPGANSGIYTVITLNNDLSYTLSYQYVDKSTEVYLENGSFSWSKDGGSITLDVVNFPSRYQVGENALIQLDNSGKKIKGQLADKYILLKK